MNIILLLEYKDIRKVEIQMIEIQINYIFIINILIKNICGISFLGGISNSKIYIYIYMYICK